MQQVQLLIWKHDNYWVRFASLRLFGYLFECMQNNKEISFKSILNIQDADGYLKLIYQHLGVINFSHATKELMTQLLKNLVFLVKNVTESKVQYPNTLEILEKTFKKSSYIGRKLLGIETTESNKEKLLAIHQFYAVCISQLDSSQVEQVCPIILELVYRTYTQDDQNEIKDQSI